MNVVKETVKSLHKNQTGNMRLNLSMMGKAVSLRLISIAMKYK